ncbi:MAG: hypothetical protein M5R42_18235 [Rhodocyclaceae bacterium]|nr:hypothetical protein [Rhodocyclaceae bacterium]
MGRRTLLTDFQLQPEHALDLEDAAALFVDASVSCAAPFAFGPLQPLHFGHTTHAMKPEALLAVFRQITGGDPPPAWLLTVRGGILRAGRAAQPHRTGQSGSGGEPCRVAARRRLA